MTLAEPLPHSPLHEKLFGEMHWIYEVNLSVEAPVREAYLQWLREHIEEMTALPTFESAKLLEDEQGQWVVQYFASSKAQIDRYLEEFAPKMRGDGLRRFEGQFTAKRRILAPFGVKS